MKLRVKRHHKIILLIVTLIFATALVIILFRASGIVTAHKAMAEAQVQIEAGEYGDAAATLHRGIHNSKVNRKLKHKMVEVSSILVNDALNQGADEVASRYAIQCARDTEDESLVTIVVIHLADVAQILLDESEDYYGVIVTIEGWKADYSGLDTSYLDSVLADAYLLAAEEYAFNPVFYVEFLNEGLESTNHNEKIVSAIAGAQDQVDAIEAINSEIQEWADAYANLEDASGYYVYLDASDAPYLLAEGKMYHYEHGEVVEWGTGAEKCKYRFRTFYDANMIAYQYTVGEEVHYELHVMNPTVNTCFGDTHYYLGQFFDDGTQSWELCDVDSGEREMLDVVKQGEAPSQIKDALVRGYWDDAPWYDLPESVYFIDTSEAFRYYKKAGGKVIISQLYE